MLLLVVSETGLVYTFTTPKLQPLVTKAEGKNLIQVCTTALPPAVIAVLTRPAGLLERPRARIRRCQWRRGRPARRVSRGPPSPGPPGPAARHAWQRRNAPRIHDPRSRPPLPVLPPATAADGSIPGHAPAGPDAPPPGSPIPPGSKVELNGFREKQNQLGLFALCFRDRPARVKPVMDTPLLMANVMTARV